MNSNDSKIKLAVFDFDGTIIPDQSGQQLSKHLLKTNQFSKSTVVRLLFWGLRYKAHLPYKEKTARELIFRVFENRNADAVHEYIDSFYEIHLEDTVRKLILDIAEELRQDGYELVILSAAFTPILESFAKRHDFVHVVGTKMEVNEEGKYTGKVLGECVAGEEKIKHLVEYSNKTFGKDNWVIECAFADHYTDRDLLDLAHKVYAVDPDKTLRRYANKNNWQIIDFNDKKE